MIKFFRNTRKQLFTENKFTKYLFYAIGEIILVVIGILIALQINNWNNQRLEKEDENKSYRNIKRQIEDDRKELTDVKAFNNYFSATYKHANKIIRAQDFTKSDSLALIAMGLSQYSDFNSSGNIYETLVNSGNLKLLKNDEITSLIQQLENTYIFANKLETIHWEIIINELSPALRGVVNFDAFKAVKPERLYEVEMQNIFVESIYLTSAKDSVYSKAIREIDTIINLINTELGAVKD
ncbi:DUF6090 family protein [uncultured Eudoraea sp.]|uniref:DUF6090 family protein n=1 Tax=uncultured Eudoraea sp. TaxID=1035614 RepID=UPI002619F735|nr:DUF6090 family protein [uncultured Eudoraea sp.]